MLELLAKGGPIMIVLLVCSLVGAYIVIQKILFLRLNRINGQHVIDAIKTRLHNEGKHSTVKFLHRDNKVMTSIMANVIHYAGLPSNEVQAAIQQVTRKDLQQLDRNMGTLSAIVTVAPILGLLGTVLGLMDIFNVISGGGIGDPALLSGGIAKALITTVAGLTLSVPFIFLHSLLSRLIDQFSSRTESYANDLLYFVRSNGGLKP